MAVYKRNYSAYTGELTSARARVLVLARYAFAEAWSSKITIGLFTASLLPCIVFLFGIYLANNPLARALIGNGNGPNLEIGAKYFLRVMQVQCWMALVMTAWIAPRSISYDLADNAMPILLSHPISRIGYVSGKFIALVASLSFVSWVPCLLLFLYQGYSSPLPWAAANLRIALGIFVGAVAWIGFLAVVGLAVSSWVKWRGVATGAIFAAFLIPSALGAVVSGVLRTKWGLLLNFPVMMANLWQRLLGAPSTLPALFQVPTAAIVAMLAFACLVCAAMLNKRIRAREVARG